jgi:hypothetical protein
VGTTRIFISDPGAGSLCEHRFAELDIANLIDEVDSVRSSEKRKIRSRLTVASGSSDEMEIPAGRSSAWMDEHDRGTTPLAS